MHYPLHLSHLMAFTQLSLTWAEFATGIVSAVLYVAQYTIGFLFPRNKKRKQRRDRMCLQDFIYWVISHINPQWYTGINIHFCTVGKNQGWKTKATAIFLAQSATDDLMLWWSVYRASTHSFTPPGMIGFWWKFQTVTWWIFIKSLPKVKVMFAILCEL